MKKILLFVALLLFPLSLSGCTYTCTISGSYWAGYGCFYDVVYMQHSTNEQTQLCVQANPTSITGDVIIQDCDRVISSNLIESTCTR